MTAAEPMFLQANDYEAKQLRRLASALLGYARFADLSPSTTLSNEAHGVCEYGHLKVTEKSGTPNMSVDVAAGAAFIAGTQASDQGCYFAENDASVNVVIAAADGSNPRDDLIVARVRDAAYSGSDNDLQITVVQGTAAASPSDPSVPEDCIVLARVRVGTGVTSITNANITDLRVASSVWSRPRGRIDVKTSTSLNQTLTGSEADVSGLSISTTLVEGRRYEAWLEISHYDSGGAGTVEFRITDGSNNVYDGGQFRSLVAGSAVKHRLTAPDITGSGAATVKARGTSIAATVTQFAFASSTLKARLALYDVGGYLG